MEIRKEVPLAIGEKGTTLMCEDIETSGVPKTTNDPASMRADSEETPSTELAVSGKKNSPSVAQKETTTMLGEGVKPFVLTVLSLTLTVLIPIAVLNYAPQFLPLAGLVIMLQLLISGQSRLRYIFGNNSYETTVLEEADSETISASEEQELGYMSANEMPPAELSSPQREDSLAVMKDVASTLGKRVGPLLVRLLPYVTMMAGLAFAVLAVAAVSVGGQELTAVALACSIYLIIMGLRLRDILEDNSQKPAFRVDVKTEPEPEPDSIAAPEPSPVTVPRVAPSTQPVPSLPDMAIYEVNAMLAAASPTTSSDRPAFEGRTLPDGNFELLGLSSINSDVLEIPSEVGGLLVTRIGAGAFSGLGRVRIVVLPATVREVAPNAFDRMPALEQVHFSGPVDRVEQRAFSGCSTLRGCWLPDGTGELCTPICSGCASLTEVRVPSSASIVGDAPLVENCPRVAIAASVGSDAHANAYRYGLPYEVD